MSTRVENALKEYERKYMGQIGEFELQIGDMKELGKRDNAFDMVSDSFDMGFVAGVRYAEKMKKVPK